MAKRLHVVVLPARLFPAIITNLSWERSYFLASITVSIKLEELAEKISKTVLRTGKSITLEPMTAYERKIIHSKLQENTRVETHSIGEGDNRRIVISKIK